MRKYLFILFLIISMTILHGSAAEMIIDLTYDHYPISNQTAVVKVTNEVLNTVKSSIFGANTSYINGGYGIYNEKTNSFNDLMVNALSRSGVTSLRLPGGIEGDYFHWYESVGPLENRIAQINPFSKEYPTYARENGAPYLVAFGPDEWFELCKRTGTSLSVQLNAGNGTPQEAVDFIRYCLDSGVDIDDITVGNEVCMAAENVDGMTVTKTPEEYAAFYLDVWNLMGEELRDELKAREIPFGCIGIPRSHPLCAYRQWDDTVLALLKDKTDFIDIHVAYSPYFVTNNSQESIVKCLLASSARVRKHLDVELSSIDKNAPDTLISISEHAPLGAGAYSRGIAGGLYLASFFNVVLEEEKVISADYLPLTNHPAANNLLGYSNNAEDTVLYDNVVSYVFRMYAEQINRKVLSAQVTGAKTFTAPAVGLMTASRGVSEGEAAVYYDEKTGEGTLFILNKAYAENTRFDVTLPFEQMDISAVTELFSSDLTMYNNVQCPTSVTPLEHAELCGSLSDGTLQIIAKPVSLIKIDFKTR